LLRGYLARALEKLEKGGRAECLHSIGFIRIAVDVQAGWRVRRFLLKGFDSGGLVPIPFDFRAPEVIHHQGTKTPRAPGNSGSFLVFLVSWRLGGGNYNRARINWNPD
jgi:hypothetical protein